LLVVFIVWHRPSLTTGTLRFRVLQTYLLTSALIVPRATIKRTSELYIFLTLQSRDDFLSVHFSRFDGPFWVADPEIRTVADTSELWIPRHGG
jgi:hypothetical protein